MVNDWAKLEAKETGYQTFVLQVMEGNKLFTCAEVIKVCRNVKMTKEWEIKVKQNRTFEKWNEKIS